MPKLTDNQICLCIRSSIHYNLMPESLVCSHADPRSPSVPLILKSNVPMFSGKAGTEWRQLFVALITCGLLALNSAFSKGPERTLPTPPVLQIHVSSGATSSDSWASLLPARRCQGCRPSARVSCISGAMGGFGIGIFSTPRMRVWFYSPKKQ